MQLRKLFRYILITLVTGLLAAQGHASDSMMNVDGLLAEFESYLKETIIPNVPGAALIVVIDGKVRHVGAYGVRQTGLNDPITPDTVFRLASVSKAFAATATGILVRNDLLSWDTTIKSRLEGIVFKDPNYGKQITVRNLLSHTTGLMPHAYTNLVEDNVPYKVIVRRLDEVDFICAPGQCYSYQNVIFSLAGDIIHSVTGKSYEEFVHENLFLPLGMKTASFGLQSFKSTHNRAIPHVRRNMQWQPVEVSGNYYNIAPAAGVNASIRDMEQWLLAQLGQRPDVLSESTLDDLHTKTIRTTRLQSHYGHRKELGDIYYGLGWRIFDFGEHKDFVHHGGWVQGTLAEMIFNRKLQIGMVFLTNAETPYAGDLVFKFLEIFRNSNRLPQKKINAHSNNIKLSRTKSHM